MLLTAQVLAIVAYPFRDGNRVGAAVLGVLSIVAVGLAMALVRSTPALTVIAVAIGLPALVMTILESVLPGEEWVSLVSALLHAPFYFYVSSSTIRYLFHDDRVTTDELFAIAAAFTWWPGASPTCTSVSTWSPRARSSRWRTPGPPASSTCCSSRSPTSPASGSPTSSRAATTHARW